MRSDSSANSAHTSDTQRSREENIAFWNQHHQRWSVSGLNRKAYCRDQQLNYDCFQYWHHKFSKEVSSRPESKPTVNASLIPVKLSNPESSAQALCQLNADNGGQLLVFDSKLANALIDRLL